MLKMSGEAAIALKAVLTKQGRSYGLRVRLTPFGCSGRSYDIIYDREKKGDNVSSQNGIKIFLDPETNKVAKMFKEEVFISYGGLRKNFFHVSNPRFRVNMNLHELEG